MDNIERRLADVKQEASEAIARSADRGAVIATRARKERVAILSIGPLSVLLLVVTVFGLVRSWELGSSQRMPPATTGERNHDEPRDERPPYEGVPLRGRSNGSDRLVRLVFPDGTSTVMRYDRTLGIERMGARPEAGVTLDIGDAPCATLLVATRGEGGALHPPGEPLERYQVDGRSAELWDAYPKDPAGRYLIFRAGPWHLGLADTPDRCVSAPRNAGLWVRNFHPYVVGPLVAIRGDVRLHEAAVVWATSDLYLQARLIRCRAAADTSSDHDNLIVHRSNGFARWCRRGSDVEFSAETSNPRLLDRLVEGVSTS